MGNEGLEDGLRAYLQNVDASDPLCVSLSLRRTAGSGCMCHANVAEPVADMGRARRPFRPGI
jgi:hypothetical protein